jgi:hypothetical protein
VALKSCTVIIHDLTKTEHSFDVTAETLYEAVAQAITAIQAHDWAAEIGKGLTSVTVKIRNPEITHVVQIQEFESWLNRGCKSPAETVLKNRLRQMLGLG